MTKYAFWTTLAGSGGSEVLWQQLAARMVATGDRLFVSLYDAPANAKFLNQARSWGAAVDPRPARGNRLRTFLKDSTTSRGRHSRTLQSFAPDCIVINSDSTLWVRDEELVGALGRLGVPYVVLIHGAGGFFEDQYRERARALYRSAAAICFVAEYTWRMVERHLAMDLENARVVRNPVNASLSVDHPPEFPPLESRVVMATVSRLNCYTKGHDYLLAALADARFRKSDFALDVYGDGPQKGYLADAISYYGLEGNVRLRGYAENISEIWRGAHLHVMPSITESAPIALVEAMLCARPSVATRVGGVSEWLTDQEDGFLAENANEWNLAPALESALENAHRLKQMGQAARSKALSMMGHPLDDMMALLGGLA